MFTESSTNHQQSIFDSLMWMNPRTAVLLKNSWAPVINEFIFNKIDEKPFAVLYSKDKGAPNFPVRILLTLEVIKHMLDITDDELFEKYNFDYLVNYALGLHAIGEKPLSARTLYYFRERIYVYTANHPDEEDLIFGQFKDLTQAMRIKAGLDMKEQRIDTTQFMSNIKKSGRISLAYDVLVKGAGKIPEEKRSETAKTILAPTFKQDIIYKAKSSEADGKLTQLLRYCQDILNELEQLDEVDASNEIRIIKRLLSEQSVTEETGELVAKPGKQISPTSLQSAYDEDATYRKKGNKGHIGYVASITETCSEENDFQVITDYSIEPNNISDVEILNDRIESIGENGCETLYTDGGFYSTDIIDEASEQGIDIRYTNMTGKSGDENNLSVDDFELNETITKIEKCPAGKSPIESHPSEKSISARFEKSECGQCPLREQCPVKIHKNVAVVRFSNNQIEASEQRKAILENSKENTSKRAAIEGTNSALKRKGMSKLKVRGKEKVTIVCGLKIIAQNVSRFIKYIRGFYDKKSYPLTQGIVMPI